MVSFSWSLEAASSVPNYSNEDMYTELRYNIETESLFDWHLDEAKHHKSVWGNATVAASSAI